MTWKRALEADARLAAKNATKIRAALRQSINATSIVEAYQQTQPQPTGNLAQTRARARSWAIINIRVNLETFKEVLIRVLAEGYVLGDVAAREQLALARERKKSTDTEIDWSRWRPGDAVTAILVKPPKAFQQLLARYDITLKGFNSTTLDDIGNALGEAIELGLSAKQTAKKLSAHVASPSRALTIAVTEQNRAMSAATINRYKEAGTERVEWIASDPCPKCLANDGQVVTIGAAFPSGDTQPPAHPNCRCALLPVIEGFDEPSTQTITEPTQIQPPAVAQPISQEAQDVRDFIETLPERATENTFVPGKWKELSRDAVKQEIMREYAARYPGMEKERLELWVTRGDFGRATKSLVEKGIVYKNGNAQVRFYAGGASVPKARQKEIVKMVDKLQTANPNREINVIIGPSKKGAYGWATLGGDSIWLAPKTAKTGVPNLIEGGSYKMPVLREIPQWKYTLIHEWGHHIDEGSSFYGQSAARSAAVQRLKAQFPDAFKSGYSQEKSAEFVAEMFAEWFGTEGKTDNPLVQAVAKEFGWKI